MAGGIHQLSPQKSYLAALPSESRIDAPKHYPHCSDEDEIFSHAIIYCPSTAHHRERLLLDLSDVGSDC